MSSILEIVAEPKRLEILRLLWSRECPAGEIAGQFDVTFSAISQHLRVLREAGLVSERREGRYRYYRANREALGDLAAALEALWSQHLRDLKQLIEEETQS